MQNDDLSQMNIQASNSLQQSQLPNRSLSQSPVVSTPFTNIIRIEAFFEQSVKIQGSEEPQKVTKVQDGTGFLIGKNKVFTSASLLYSNQTKTQANYVLLYPESQEAKGGKKGIKSKNIHINEQYNFQKPLKKFANNFAIIFTQQNLTKSSIWQSFQFDWTYDEDYESKENVTIAGYRWKESQKIYEKVFKQFKPSSKENGIFKTKSKLLRGEDGSPLIISEKDEKYSDKIIYRIVGIITKSEENTPNAIEFGYLIEDKQIWKKQAKSLGAEVIFSIHASKTFQDLKKQQSSIKSQIMSQSEIKSHIKKVQDQAQVPSDDISVIMQSTLAQKTSRINELQHEMKLYQEQLVVIKGEKSQFSVEAEEVNELSSIIISFKDENEALNRKVFELIDKAEQLEIQKRKVLHLTGREKELRLQNQRLQAELVAKDNQLTQKAIKIMSLEESLANQVNQIKPLIQPSSSSSSSITSTQPQRSPQQPSCLPSQVPNPNSSPQPQLQNQTLDISQQFEYLMFAFQTIEQSKKRYHIHSQQEMDKVKTSMSVNLNKQLSTLDHSKMLFHVDSFVKYWWQNLQVLDLSESGIDNMVWEDLSAFGYMMPRLKVLILTSNEVNEVRPKDLELFVQLKVIVLDSQKFNQQQVSAFKTYETQRANTLKFIYK